MLETFVAYMLICGLEGTCKMFKDQKVPSVTVAACQVKLDNMWKRVKGAPGAVEKYVGKLDMSQTPRGYCLTPQEVAEHGSKGTIDRHYEF